MGMTTLLTVTAMFAAVRQTGPTYSYCSCLDIWMVSVMFFVFAVIVEFIFSNYFVLKGKKDMALKLDGITRIIYPIVFLFYNALYWPQVLNHYYEDPCESNF